MNKVTMSGNDGFWARVRAVLGGAQGDEVGGIGQPGRKPRPAQPIEDELQRGWDEAAQRRVSLCVLALEMDGYPDYFAAYGRETVEASLETLESVISNVLPREEDHCLRSGQAGFVLILPDMPGLMARELGAKIAAAVRRAGLPHRESHAGHVTLSMGLAVINPEGAYDASVLDGAAQAVDKAQRRGIGRLEIVDYRVLNEKRRAAA
jgi:diguanylate cyclase (GGDEF)-like protein